MKTILTIVFLSLSAFVSGQIVLDKICLSEICLGAQGENEKKFPGIVAGIEGNIFTQTLNDGRIWFIYFCPKIGPDSIARTISENELHKLVTWLDSEFGVQMARLVGKISKSGKVYESDFSKNGHDYLIQLGLQTEKYREPPIVMALWISDAELLRIHSEEEEKRKASSDL